MVCIKQSSIRRRTTRRIQLPGTYSTKYMSPRMIYFLFIYIGMSYLWQNTLTELLTLIRKRHVQGEYLLFTLLFVHPIPIVFISEAKKLNDYLNEWLAFQRRYLEITGRKLNLISLRMKLITILIKALVFVCLLLMLRYQFSEVSFLSKMLTLYYYWVVTVLSSVWYWIIYLLNRSARTMQSLAAVSENSHCT